MGTGPAVPAQPASPARLSNVGTVPGTVPIPSVDLSVASAQLASAQVTASASTSVQSTGPHRSLATRRNELRATLPRWAQLMLRHTRTVSQIKISSKAKRQRRAYTTEIKVLFYRDWKASRLPLLAFVDSERFKEANLDLKYGTISGWMKELEHLVNEKGEHALEALLQSELATKSKTRLADYPEMEDYIFNLASGLRANRHPVSKEYLVEKALGYIASHHPDDVGSFKASTGWWDNFTARKGLVSSMLHGEAGSVPAQAHTEIANVRSRLAKFPLSNIFNVDETGKPVVLRQLEVQPWCDA